jgi:hypothetical protein
MSDRVDLLTADVPGALQPWSPARRAAVGAARQNPPGLREDLAELAPVGAALAVLVLLLGGILIGGAVDRIGRGAAPTIARLQVGPDTPSDPDRIMQRCAEARVNAADAKQSRLLAYMIDQGGWAAVLSGPAGYWFCSEDRDVRDGAELDAAASAPYRGARAALPAQVAAPAYQRLSGQQRAHRLTRPYAVGGLIGPDVTGVVVVLNDGRRLQTAVGGGSYVARAYVTGQVHAVAVLGYDGTGRVLQTVRVS